MNAVDKAWKVAKKALLADMKVQRKTSVSGKINMGRSVRVAKDAFKAEMPGTSDEECETLGWKLYLSVL